MKNARAVLCLTMVVCGALASAGVAPAMAAVRVNPTGVNVSTQGATTVFLTFGGLINQTPAEAFWCGELISAAPDIGTKCDPATIFGQLPLRFDQSRVSGTGGFTDIMSIPPSVARRAYQAAESGSTSTFFYVRRYAEIERFNVFLPPTGRYTLYLQGPDPARLPTTGDGTHLILLRVEASDDKESDSSLAAIDAGPGVVHSGAVAGFPMPVVRYVVGGANVDVPTSGAAAMLPADGATVPADRRIEFTWRETAQASVYRLEILNGQGQLVLAALVPGRHGDLSSAALAQGQDERRHVTVAGRRDRRGRARDRRQRLANRPNGDATVRARLSRYEESI